MYTWAEAVKSKVFSLSVRNEYHYDITEMLLRVALNIINVTLVQYDKHDGASCYIANIEVYVVICYITLYRTNRTNACCSRLRISILAQFLQFCDQIFEQFRQGSIFFCLVSFYCKYLCVSCNVSRFQTYILCVIPSINLHSCNTQSSICFYALAKHQRKQHAIFYLFISQTSEETT